MLRNEVGAEQGLALLQNALVSSVNLAEVLTKLDDLAMDSLPRVEELLGLLDGVVPFTERQARVTASLRNLTRDAGLSLGDRACIALAIDLDADVYTADRAWMKVKLPCRVHLIR